MSKKRCAPPPGSPRPRGAAPSSGGGDRPAKRPHPRGGSWSDLVESDTEDLALGQVGQHFSTVRSVVAWMRSRGEVWTALRRLRMPRIKMGLRTVEQLQRIAPHMRSLDLLLVQKHCDEVLPFSSHMEELVFPRSSRMTDAGLCATLNACPKLVSIEWMECNQISDVSMEHALMACPSLTKVKLVRCTWVTGNTLLYLSGESGGSLHETTAHTGTKLQGVQQVARGAAKGGNGGASAQRTVVEASRDVFAEASGGGRRRRPGGIEWLELNQCEALCSASMAHLRHLAGSLRTLSLKGCSAIDSKAAPHIALCTRLTMLDLAWVGIDDEAIRHIAERCVNLRILGLSSTRVTDRGVWHMTPRCVSKRLRGESLPSGEVSESQLQLRQLSLRSCAAVTAESCHYLAAWPALEAVDLGGLALGAGTAFLARVGWRDRRCQQFQCPAGGADPALFSRHSHLTLMADFD